MSGIVAFLAAREEVRLYILLALPESAWVRDSQLSMRKGHGIVHSNCGASRRMARTTFYEARASARSVLTMVRKREQMPDVRYRWELAGNDDTIGCLSACSR